MNTFTQIYYHIIFSTKNRTKSLEKEKRDQLFKYIWGILKNKRCHLYRINGIEDHIHIFTHLHPTIPLASLVKDIKLVSTDFIKKEALFLNFNGWQKGYAAFTVTIREKSRLISYIKNQEIHHQKLSFQEELKQILTHNGLEYDEKYLD
ncbi:IS200/IS605 family transposase [soil metagenome]